MAVPELLPHWDDGDLGDYLPELQTNLKLRNLL